MRINWSGDENAPAARIIDLATGLELDEFCLWADDETGEREVMLNPEDDVSHGLKTEIRRGAIRIEPIEVA